MVTSQNSNGQKNDVELATVENSMQRLTWFVVEKWGYPSKLYMYFGGGLG